jgi:hypothetical protein
MRLRAGSASAERGAMGLTGAFGQGIGWCGRLIVRGLRGF